MAQKGNPATGRSAPKRRRERRPNIPADTQLDPIAPAESPLAMSSSSRIRVDGLRDRKRAATPGLRSSAPIDSDYGYVRKDLMRIGIVCTVLAAMVAGLFVAGV